MRKILSEEEYMERLGLILKRDFFPGEGEGEGELKEFEKLSMSEFQSLFTTEDNASFSELLERENARKRAKFIKIYGGPPELCDNPDKKLLLLRNDFEFKGGKEVENSNIISSPKIEIQNTRFTKRTEPSVSSQRFRIMESAAREQLAHSLSTPSRRRAEFTSTTPRPPPTTTTTRNTITTAFSLNDLKAFTPRRKPSNNKLSKGNK